MKHIPLILLGVLLFPAGARAQVLQHPSPYLHYVFPAGGRQGETVTVELGGQGGFTGASSILVEGPAGITVDKVHARNDSNATAVLKIAADAPPGRRLLRLCGGSNGMTNPRPFFVSNQAEIREKEANNNPAEAQAVELPATINAQLNPKVDVDCFRFLARAGQTLTAAVLAHGMDTLLRGGKLNGFLDTQIDLLDDNGRVLASADDSFGLDPLVHFTVPADGWYIARVQALGYAGAASAVYRLTLGDIGYATHVFPAGGQRGRKVEVEVAGCNLPAGCRQMIAVPAGDSAVEQVDLVLPRAFPRTLPFLCGDHPEQVEREPNDAREKAEALALPVTVNGRFATADDVDWFRVSLKKGQGILVEVTAQRHLHSPVDSWLEIYDATGAKIAENDDGPLFAGQCEHDFPSADSWLSFTANKAGDCFICLGNRSGSGGDAAIYRLCAAELRPDFHLFQWPDAVPIWGPGTTASFLVQVQRWGGLKSDLSLHIEGLPPGWQASVGHASAASYYPPRGLQNQKALLTITAPADARVGDIVPFRVLGRAVEDGRTIKHVAQPLSLYGSSFNDRMHLRYSTRAYAVAAGHLDSWLETDIRALTVRQGETVQIPVTVHRRTKTPLGITVDGEGPNAISGWRTPLTLKADEEKVLLPLTISMERKPGTYGIVASRSWASDFRAGRPGPCTPLIRLQIEPKR